MALREFFLESVPHGQERLARAVQELVGQYDAHLCSYLDGDDDPFLEPLAFTALSQGGNRTGLRQNLLGYLSPGMRADLGPIPIEIGVDGQAYLPNLGYLSTPVADTAATLHWNDRRSRPVVTVAGTQVPTAFRPLLKAGTSAELFEPDGRLLAQLYFDDSGRHGCDNPISVGSRHLAHVQAALDILTECYELYPLISEVCPKLSVFDDARMNSFATMAAHGAAFMNVRTGTNEVFFVEDIVHQTGHVLFNAATALDRQAYFEVPPDMALTHLLADGEDDLRTVYVAMHGIVTEALIADTLASCYASGRFTGRQEHELLGRLAYITTRFFLDLRTLNVRGLFSTDGERLYEDLVDTFNRVHGEYRSSLASIDVSNQPYNFDYDRFCERNPAARFASRPSEPAPTC